MVDGARNDHLRQAGRAGAGQPLLARGIDAVGDQIGKFVGGDIDHAGKLARRRQPLTRSTQRAVPPKDETAMSGACLMRASRFVFQFLAAAATARAAFSITAPVTRLSATSPIEGYMAMSLSATYHCAAVVPATALTITLGTR